MRRWAASLVVLLVALPALALNLEGTSGSWDLTLQLLPTTRIYSSELDLTFTVAGWEITSESKIYSSGYKYQNFYLSGSLGGWDVWGKIYFHVQEVRYQKAWLDFKLPVGGGSLTLSVNHWASKADYSSSDEEMFGPWPCNVISWDRAKDHYGETLYVQGPVVSTYESRSGNVTIHVGLDYPDPDRFDIYIPSSYVPDFRDKFGADFPKNLVGKTICIYGYIKTFGGIYEIETHDPDDLEIGPCCGEVNALGPLMIYRGKLEWDPFTLTVDFFDCCSGIAFRKLTLEGKGLSLCCGLTYDAELSFSKCHGLESFSAIISGLSLPCCDISLDLKVDFTVDSKTVSIEPSWGGIEGCFSLYGDVNWNGVNVINGLDIWGYSISCSIEPLSVRVISALNPDKVEEVTDITFYSGEWEYLGLEYTGPGCCGGEIDFTAEFWFGDYGILFGVQRAKYYFEVPLAEDVAAFMKAQWDFSNPYPLDWFDIGWKMSF